MRTAIYIFFMAASAHASTPPGEVVLWKFNRPKGVTIHTYHNEKEIRDKCHVGDNIVEWPAGLGGCATAKEAETMLPTWTEEYIAADPEGQKRREEQEAKAVELYERLQSLRQYRATDPHLAADTALLEAVDHQIKKLSEELAQDKEYSNDQGSKVSEEDRARQAAWTEWASQKALLDLARDEGDQTLVETIKIRLAEARLKYESLKR